MCEMYNEKALQFNCLVIFHSVFPRLTPVFILSRGHNTVILKLTLINFNY